MGKTIGNRKKRKLKARAVKVKEKEYQQEITNKFKERLQRQDAYCETKLKRLCKEAKLIALDRTINIARDMKQDTIIWLGDEYPIDIMITERNLELFYWKKNLKHEVYLKKALLNDGLTEADINLVEKGEYKKDDGKLKKLNKNKEMDYIG